MIFSRMKKVLRKRSTSLLPPERAVRDCPGWKAASGKDDGR